MARMFDCPHCGVTTALPEGMYLDSDDCDSCGRNYWETPLPEEEETSAPGHSAEDSLLFLKYSAIGLLESADEQIHGWSLERVLETEELPEHIQTAVAMIQTVRELIELEADLHNPTSKAEYSNGIPVREHYQKLEPEQQEDGTTVLVTRNYFADVYPDGFRHHPAYREEEA
ncbi:hypothetical protein CGLAR1_12555 [Corynebacterium glutamicum]|uniref:hypothetical protein n=1 Tax=Corynebacterium glutamicum TaxID=1718 RepID=UPI0004F74FCF|nr:hypothetical protein [Corynebacterium glutamicum]AIK86034.1 hypothetical protein CGLAR1_12555 [Corynebacterium glutamicum]AIK88817.1 hypothetical protein AR0_12690 [Corynebacterium glutamicum]